MNRLFTKKVGLALATGALALSAAAIAGNNFMVEKLYYSDASKTQVVGESFEGCSGNVYVSGRVTPYFRVVGREPCQGVIR